MALVAAIGWRITAMAADLAARGARGRLVAVAGWAHWFIDSQGIAGDPAPWSLWMWIGVTGMATGGRGARLARQPGGGVAAVSLLAVLVCLLSAGYRPEPLGGVLPHGPGWRGTR